MPCPLNSDRFSISTLEAWLCRCGSRPSIWLLGFAAVFALQVNPWWYATPDGAEYLSMARSIAAGQQVAVLGRAGFVRPPGYPLLISPAFLIADRPFLALSLINCALAIVFMLGLYRWACNQSPPAALLLTGLAMVNVSLWINYRRTLSELAFMTVMMWTAHHMNTVLGGEPTRRSGWRTAAGTQLMIFLATIREVGLLLAAGFSLGMLPRARRGATAWKATTATALIAGTAAFIALTLMARERVNFVSSLFLEAWQGRSEGIVTLVGLVLEGLRLRMSEVGRLLVPGMFKAYGEPGDWLDLNMVLYLPIFILVVVGWVRFVRRRGDVLALMLPIYFGVCVAYRFDQGTRYMLPMLPVLLACLWFIIEPCRRWRMSFLAFLLVAHLTVALGYWVARDMPRARECNAQWPVIELLASRIVAHPGPVVAPRIPMCIVSMLSFAADRPVWPDDARTPRWQTAQWIITSGQDAPVPGFRYHSDAGRYELFINEGSGSAPNISPRRSPSQLLQAATSACTPRSRRCGRY